MGARAQALCNNFNDVQLLHRTGGLLRARLPYGVLFKCGRGLHTNAAELRRRAALDTESLRRDLD